jgi:hypothetical protein
METAFSNIENRKYFADVQHLADVGHLSASFTIIHPLRGLDNINRYGFNGMEADHNLNCNFIINNHYSRIRGQHEKQDSTDYNYHAADSGGSSLWSKCIRTKVLTLMGILPIY